jgi:hypothetical protein
MDIAYLSLRSCGRIFYAFDFMSKAVDILDDNFDDGAGMLMPVFQFFHAGGEVFVMRDHLAYTYKGVASENGQ